MSTYFGFIPSAELNEKIEATVGLVNDSLTSDSSDVAFYPLQLEMTNRIAHELLDNILIHLIDIIENEKRKARMERVVATINSAVDVLLKHIIVEQPNELVLDSFNFLVEECLFIDNDGQRRVGFQLSETEAQIVLGNFKQAKETDDPYALVQEAMNVLIKANITHFVKNLAEHLHLSLVKRKTLPVAEATINKASEIAINKLLPDMPYIACIRLMDHFETFLISKED